MDNLDLLKKKDSTQEKKTSTDNKKINSHKISMPRNNINNNNNNNNSSNISNNQNNEAKFVFDKKKDLMPLVLLIIGFLLIILAIVL